MAEPTQDAEPSPTTELSPHAEPSPTSEPTWADVQEALRAFVAERDWAQFHDPKNLAMLIGSEAGELLAELRWVNNAESDTFCADTSHRPAVLDELADTAIGVLLLADRLGVDLPRVMMEKIQKNRAKYPVESSRGRFG